MSVVLLYISAAMRFYIPVSLLKGNKDKCHSPCYTAVKSLMLKHTGAYKKGQWINSTQFVLQITLPNYSVSCSWLTINTYLKFSQGVFSHSSKPEAKGKMQEVAANRI